MTKDKAVVSSGVRLALSESVANRGDGGERVLGLFIGGIGTLNRPSFRRRIDAVEEHPLAGHVAGEGLVPNIFL